MSGFEHWETGEKFLKAPRVRLARAEMLMREEREKLRIYQAERVVIGHCPECAAVLVLLNDREVWPPAICGCGWAGASTDLLNHVRFERGGHGGAR